MTKYFRIRDLREDHDITQKEIADYLGTSTQHYGKYELGHAEIPFDRAIKLARYYGVSLDYLAGLTNVKTPAYDIFLSEHEKRLIAAVRSLTDEELEKFADISKLISDCKK